MRRRLNNSCAICACKIQWRSHNYQTILVTVELISVVILMAKNTASSCYEKGWIDEGKQLIRKQSIHVNRCGVFFFCLFIPTPFSSKSVFL